MCLYYCLSGRNNIIVLTSNYWRKHLINMLCDTELLFLKNLLDCKRRSCHLQITNTLQHFGPLNWKLIQIQKHQKVPQTNRLTNILYFHSGYLNPWLATARAARNYGPHTLITKKQRRRTDRHISSTGPLCSILVPSLRNNTP